MKIMKQVLNYNIHNILKIQIILNKKFRFFNYINIEHRFFEVENLNNPDIILNIGKFEPSNKDCYIVDNKYYIKNNYFYCNDSAGKTRWEVEIFGFESGDTIINLNIKIPGIRNLFPILSAHNIFLGPLIDYKLSRNGYFLLHSAGLSKNNKAYLLAGMGGAFKTTLAMDFVRKAGFDFLGDERVILHEKDVWSYPVGLLSFGYRCKYLPTEKKRNFLDKINLIRYNMNNYYHLSHVNVNTVGVSKLSALFFIGKHSERKSITLNHFDFDKAIYKLVINNKIEMNQSYMPNLMGISYNPYFKYMLAYSFIFPKGPVAMHWDNLLCNLRRALENVPLYDIELPIEYGDRIFKDILHYITSLER